MQEGCWHCSSTSHYQKVLVVEDGQRLVSIHFNDIVALAELHYGSSSQPQAVINQRLASTLGCGMAGAGWTDAPVGVGAPDQRSA
jgi:hypothetical protein